MLGLMLLPVVSCCLCDCERALFVRSRVLLVVFAGVGASTGKSTGTNKKKSVRFGGPLSPEFFDKDLPPSTPLQKGGTPARAPTPGGSVKMRSVLKTPQRSQSQRPQSQPDLSSPTVFGASPTLKMPRIGRMQPVGEDSEEKDGEVGNNNDSMMVVVLQYCTWHKI